MRLSAAKCDWGNLGPRLLICQAADPENSFMDQFLPGLPDPNSALVALEEKWKIKNKQKLCLCIAKLTKKYQKLSTQGHLQLGPSQHDLLRAKKPQFNNMSLRCWRR